MPTHAVLQMEFRHSFIGYNSSGPLERFPQQLLTHASVIHSLRAAKLPLQILIIVSLLFGAMGVEIWMSRTRCICTVHGGEGRRQWCMQGNQVHAEYKPGAFLLR